MELRRQNLRHRTCCQHRWGLDTGAKRRAIRFVGFTMKVFNRLCVHAHVPLRVFRNSAKTNRDSSTVTQKLQRATLVALALIAMIPESTFAQRGGEVGVIQVKPGQERILKRIAKRLHFNPPVPAFRELASLVRRIGPEGAAASFQKSGPSKRRSAGVTPSTEITEISPDIINALASTHTISGKLVPRVKKTFERAGLALETARRFVPHALPYEGTLTSSPPGCPAIGSNAFAFQWGLHNTGQPAYNSGTASCVPAALDQDIDMEEAWTRLGGFSNVKRDVTIAVLDSGFDYDAHTDLRNSVWLNQAEIPDATRRALDTDSDGFVTNGEFLAVFPNIRQAITNPPPLGIKDGIDQDNNGYADDIVGWDVVASFPAGWPETYGLTCAQGEDCTGVDNDPDDSANHGTSVSSVVAATPDNGSGIAGIAASAHVMAVRIGFLTYNSATGTNQLQSSEIEIANGILYAIAAGADVINISWGSMTVTTNAMTLALQVAEQAGVIVVSSAGNNNSSSPSYPAAYPNVISVGAISYDGMRASFSNYGSTVDIGAPGVGIANLRQAGNYLSNGTSYASPYAAAVFGLVRSSFPCLNRERTINLVLGGTQPYLPGVSALGIGLLNANNPLVIGDDLGYCREKSPDIDGDGSVTALDLTYLLSAWGVCSTHESCKPDLNGDGYVDSADQLTLTGAWGR